MLKRVIVGSVAVIFAVVGTVTLFGDCVRREFGMSSDALAGDDNLRARAADDAPLTKKTIKHFGAESYDGNTYEYVRPNRPVETWREGLSTFAIDVDTASYALGRRQLMSGMLPNPDSVRVEEWVNAFRYGLPAPKDAPFAVSIEGAPSPFTGGRTLLKVSLKGREIANADRLPANLVFLVDTSCSMSGADRLDLAKTSLHMLVRNLNARDSVGIVTYAGAVREVLAPTAASRRDEIEEAIDSLNTSGGTDMGSGLEIAYRWAVHSVRRDAVSRVIVLTDGDANLGRNQTADQMLASIHGYVKEGVTLTTVGFGMGNYRDALLERLADKGDGQSLYIDSVREARRVFERGLSGTLETIAKDVKVQVAFDPVAVADYRLVGYENRALANADFRNDTVDGGELGAGHSVTALYEIALKPGTHARLLTVSVRGQPPHGGPAFEVSQTVLRGDVTPSLDAASADLRFAAAVAGAADVLRGNGAASDFSLEAALNLAHGAAGDDADRRELVGLLQRALELQRTRDRVSRAY